MVKVEPDHLLRRQLVGAGGVGEGLRAVADLDEAELVGVGRAGTIRPPSSATAMPTLIGTVLDDGVVLPGGVDVGVLAEGHARRPW